MLLYFPLLHFPQPDYLASDIFVTQSKSSNDQINHWISSQNRLLSDNQNLFSLVILKFSWADRNPLLWIASRNSPCWRYLMFSESTVHLGHQPEMVGMRQLFPSLLKLKHVWEFSQSIQTLSRIRHTSLEWVKVTQSGLTLCDPMDYIVHGVLHAGILEWIAVPSPGIFPTQGSNPGLPSCRRILYQLSHKGSPFGNEAKCSNFSAILMSFPDTNIWFHFSQHKCLQDTDVIFKCWKSLLNNI